MRDAFTCKALRLKSVLRLFVNQDGLVLTTEEILEIFRNFSSRFF